MNVRISRPTINARIRGQHSSMVINACGRGIRAFDAWVIPTQKDVHGYGYQLGIQIHAWMYPLSTIASQVEAQKLVQLTINEPYYRRS